MMILRDEMVKQDRQQPTRRPDQQRSSRDLPRSATRDAFGEGDAGWGVGGTASQWQRDDKNDRAQRRSNARARHRKHPSTPSSSFRSSFARDPEYTATEKSTNHVEYPVLGVCSKGAGGWGLTERNEPASSVRGPGPLGAITAPARCARRARPGGVHTATRRLDSAPPLGIPELHLALHPSGNL